MKRSSARVVAGAVVMGAVGAAFVPVAVAASHAATTLTPSGESWYQVAVVCTTPVCDTLPLAPPDLNPYPKESLHIGSILGTETSRSYLGFDLSRVSGDITSARLTVPVDLAAADGALQTDTAKVEVCLATESLRPIAGAIAVPPTTDCSHPAQMSYSAKPTPRLVADLRPLLSGLSASFGLALLPSANQDPTAAWQVVFSAHDRTGAGTTPPASLHLTTSPSQAVTTQVPTASPGEGASPTAPAVTVPLPAGVSAVPTMPADIAPSIAPTPTQNEVSTEPVGYAYPQVWLLPILVLLLVPAIVGALTRDLTPED